MARVTGLGGIFFKAKDPKKLYVWYEKKLGLRHDPSAEAVVFPWHDPRNPKRKGMTVWSIFPKNTKYFRPSRAPFMMNFRVADLDGLRK
jgi:lactoylglutathione lyase